jgi:hypothetical protein
MTAHNACLKLVGNRSLGSAASHRGQCLGAITSGPEHAGHCLGGNKTSMRRQGPSGETLQPQPGQVFGQAQNAGRFALFVNQLIRV